jgi:hypothetical protein
MSHTSIEFPVPLVESGSALNFLIENARALPFYLAKELPKLRIELANLELRPDGTAHRIWQYHLRDLCIQHLAPIVAPERFWTSTAERTSCSVTA